jgi:hypothetical protein
MELLQLYQELRDKIMNADTESGAKEIMFSAVITRADGTVENLGVISYYHKNPLKRWIWKIKKYFKLGA